MWGCLCTCWEAPHRREAGEAAAGFRAVSCRGALGHRVLRDRVWGSAVAADKGLRGGRAGFPSSDPEARRPLPASSPASGAGAGLARHLHHIDAAAASRASPASPAPGMQRRRWRAGPCLERGRARKTPVLSICLSRAFCWGLCWGIRWQARAVGSLSPLLPFLVAQRPSR